MIFLFALLASRAHSVRADEPVAQPTTQAVVALPARSSIRTWFKNLADPDPKIRDQARTDLMGMSVDDLPAFRKLVADSQPIAPAQSAALYDIVTQVYLAGQKYMTFSGETDTHGIEGPFFIGIHWTEADTAAGQRLGIPIESRMPGFPSFRYLRDGDLILSVCLDPTVSMLTLPNCETHYPDALVNALKMAPQTQNVVLQVLREGEKISLSIRLAPRPTQAETPDAMAGLNAIRTQQADNYWNENFQSLADRETVLED